MLLLNLKPPIRGTVEIDGVIIRPDCVRTIEVKYSKLSGVLVPNLNSPWKVNGAVQDQLGNPTDQAQKQAKRLKNAVRPKIAHDLGYFEACVLVLGKVRIDPIVATSLPDLTVYTADTIIPGLMSSNGKVRLTSEDVIAIFRALQLDLEYKSIESSIVNEGFARPAGQSRSVWRPELSTPLPMSGSPLRQLLDEICFDKSLEYVWILWFESWNIKNGSDLRDVMLSHGSTSEMRAWVRGHITKDPARATQIVNEMGDAYWYEEDDWDGGDDSWPDYDEIKYLNKERVLGPRSRK